MRAWPMEAPTPWRRQATAPRYSLHDLQAAYETRQLSTTAHNLPLHGAADARLQLDTTVLLLCLAYPPTGNRSLCSQSVPDSDKPCPLWLHPRACAAR